MGKFLIFLLSLNSLDHDSARFYQTVVCRYIEKKAAAEAAAAAAQPEAYRPLSLSVCCFGHFAGPLRAFKGTAEVRRVMQHLFERCSSVVSRFRARNGEDARSFASSFVHAFALLVFELDCAGTCCTHVQFLYLLAYLYFLTCTCCASP